ncbi:unnamed protein product, partial [Ixodes hexagonus]
QWATFFEPDGAHLAFPCFDEPALKATFAVTLVRPVGLTTVSNMPIVRSRKRSNSLVEDTFDKTPLMSTYTLAWFLFDKHNMTFFCLFAFFQVTVYGVGLELDSVSNVLLISKKYLEYFEQYFGINYTLPKLDIISTTRFAFYGMENWGAVFMQNVILEGSAYGVYLRENMIAHEMMHQWLGNLATNSWWTGIWLQEAPTYYLAELVSSKIGTKEHYVRCWM